MAENKCPPLGVGSVDFDAVHAAAMKGDDLQKAIDTARTMAEPPLDLVVEAAPAPAAEPQIEPDAKKSAAKVDTDKPAA